MATINVVLSTVTNAINLKDVAPVPDSLPVSSENITSSGTSAASTNAASATAFKNQIWTITASGGAVSANFAASPTASAGNDWLILDGQTRDFAVSVASEKVAVIDV